MEKKIKGLVIKNYDSGDRDKLITIFTPEGLLTAKLKGVNSPTAKLKFAKQCFCFADFVLNGDKILTVTSANLIDSFYNLTLDYDVFDEAGKILRLARPLMKENESNPYLFVQLIQSFKTLAYSKVQKNVTQVKFLLNLFYNQGYQFESEKCSSCNGVLSENRYLNLSTGEVLCSYCKNNYCQKISYGTNKVLKIIGETDYDRLNSLKFSQEILLNATSLLLNNYTNVII